MGKEFRISKLFAYEVLDSRGNPTLAVECYTEDGTVGSAMVPSGASTGSKEAVELRDGGTRFMGKGVRKAVSNVNEILAEAIVGMDVREQIAIDKRLLFTDGTDNKSRIGANAILGVSLAVSRAAANALGISLFRYLGGSNANLLPTPLMNVINGGVHADNSLDIQEFMIVPVGFSCFSDALRAGVEVYHQIKSILKSKGYSSAVGDEGGFAPSLNTNREALDILSEAIERSGYKLGSNFALALDVAASELYYEDEGAKFYSLPGEKREKLSSEQMVEYFVDLVENYPIVSIEDPMSEYDWEGWELITKELGSRVQLVGDDLFVTNSKIVREGIRRKVANAVLIKLNQVGTLSETLQTVETARLSGYRCIVSHRSGETEDSFIADLAVALGVGQIKTGAPARSDRNAKYNRLLKIENVLGENAVYLGRAVF